MGMVVSLPEISPLTFNLHHRQSLTKYVDRWRHPFCRYIFVYFTYQKQFLIITRVKESEENIFHANTDNFDGITRLFCKSFMGKYAEQIWIFKNDYRKLNPLAPSPNPTLLITLSLQLLNYFSETFPTTSFILIPNPSYIRHQNIVRW